jgi:hypothetical protein
VGVRERGERDAEQLVPADDAEPAMRHALQHRHVFVGQGYDHLASALAEPGDRVVFQLDLCAEARRERGFGERDGEPALCGVVRAREERRGAPEEANQRGFGGQLGHRRASGRAAEEERLILGAVETELGRADGVDLIAFPPGRWNEPHVCH